MKYSALLTYLSLFLSCPFPVHTIAFDDIPTITLYKVNVCERGQSLIISIRVRMS